MHHISNRPDVNINTVSTDRCDVSFCVTLKSCENVNYCVLLYIFKEQLEKTEETSSQSSLEVRLLFSLTQNIHTIHTDVVECTEQWNLEHVETETPVKQEKNVQ